LRAARRFEKTWADLTSLRRRFEQNQEDCTFTVLAILPTATDKIVDALPVENTLEELQQQKAQRLARSVGPSEIASSVADTIDDDTRSGSVSMHTDSYVHASQATLDERGIPFDRPPVPDTPTPTPQPPPADKPRRTKAQLWNDLKIGAMTRAFTLLYTLALLTLLTRIQLNLLGRRNYLASVVSLAAPPPSAQGSRIVLENHDDDADATYGNDFETNRRYLSLSWWLLHRGCLDLLEKVRTAVTEVFGAVNPREALTLERLSALTLDVRKRIEGATEAERRSCKWLSFLLPPPDLEDYVLHESGMTSSSESTSPTTATSLRRLIDETSDMIDSPAFTHVLTRLLDAAFSHLVDNKISQLAYKIPPISDSAARVQELVGGDADVTAKVANSLAVFCRQAHAIGAGANNEYLVAIEGVKELQAFAAVVYSSNFEAESPSVTMAASAIPQGTPVVGEAATLTEDDVEGFESVWGKAGAK
jgi:peroxin-3